jgi:hypothetical protein
MVMNTPFDPPGYSTGDTRTSKPGRARSGVPSSTGRSGDAPLRMPRWTDRGPYRLDLDGMLDQAITAVLARPDLPSQLEVIQDPPDLAAVAAGQRALILAGLPGLEARANRTAFELRDRLAASLASDRDQGEELKFLSSTIGWLGTTIEALETWDLGTLDQLPAAEVSAYAEILAGIDRTWAAIVTESRRHGGEIRQLRVWGRPALVSVGALTTGEQAFATVPASRRAILDQEAAWLRANDNDLRRHLELKLTGHVPMARETREYRALETEWESLQREAQAALEKAVLAAVLTALNEAVVAGTAPQMRAASLDGLRSALTDDKVVVTEAFSQLTKKLRERSEGSFGIAGPRGIGKTTLIKFLTTGPGLPPADSTDGGEVAAGKPRLGVVVSAPVRYQARDFVLYLYAELCKKVIGADADEALRDKLRDPYEGAPDRALAWLGARTGAAILGAAAVTGGAVLLGGAIRHAASGAVHILAYIGGGLLASAALVLMIMLWQVLSSAFRVSFGPVSFEISGSLTGEDSSSGRDDGTRSRSTGGLRSDRDTPARLGDRPLPMISRESYAVRHAIWCFQYAAAAIVGGTALLLTGGGWPGGSWPLVGGMTLLSVGAGCLRFLRVQRPSVYSLSTLKFPGGEAFFSFQQGSNPASTRLRELALETLLQIRVQQSFASERTKAVGITGPGILPAKLEFDVKRGVTWEEREQSYPELVSAVKTFLGAVAEEYEVVIGIDELDKLRTAESVEDFLNDIKGIFGVPGCYYLVSVSEDAAAGFERRGAPFRDVFDSSFDEVVSLQSLDLVSARKILHGLLLGWTEPFIGLCYVLSGGLPRDLWRVAHELVAQRDADGLIDIGQATLALCRREGDGRLRAVRHELTRDSFDPQKAELLQFIVDLSFTHATASDLLGWQEKLRGWAETAGTPALVGELTVSAQDGLPPGEGPPTPVRTSRSTPAARLALEAAAYLLFAASVLQFFAPELIAVRLSSPEADGAESVRAALAVLASARQFLALSPASSLAATERLREEWKL